MDTQKPIINPVVVLRKEFDDWAVLFNPDSAEAIGINPVGVVIWKQLDGSHGLDQIVSAVQDQFDDVPGGASDEISTFVDDLAQRGFVGFEISSISK